MCTLSWKPLKNGYVLFFNRDENRSRAVARGPSVHHNDGVEFLSPTDATRGGTWLLVNAHGISIGLLNNYSAPRCSTEINPSSPGRPSRGMLPLKCADCETVSQAINRVELMSLEKYPPFHLVVAGTSEAAILTWDGSACCSENLSVSGVMLTTSAFRSISVAKSRHQTFVKLVGDMADATPAQLGNFHWHTGDDGATGIRMSRPDACTHSISQITVCLDEKSACFDYSPQPDISATRKSGSQPPPQSPASSLRMMLQ